MKSFRDFCNGQIEETEIASKVDIIKSPDHYTFRGRECSDIIATMTATSNGKIAYYEGGNMQIHVPVSDERHTD